MFLSTSEAFNGTFNLEVAQSKVCSDLKKEKKRYAEMRSKNVTADKGTAIATLSKLV